MKSINMVSISNESKKRKWNFLTISLISLICIPVLTEGFFYSLQPINETGIESLSWDTPPHLLGIREISRDGQSGLLFLRLLDKKEQFFPGVWTTSMNPDDSSFIFGRLPENYAGTGKQFVFYLSNVLIHEINLEGFSGEITNIVNDPTGTITLIEITDTNGTFYCLARNILQQSPECQELNINKKTQSIWPKDQPDVIVLKTEDKQLYNYTISEKKMRFIDPKKSPKEHTEALALFEENLDHKASDLKNIFNILSIQRGQSTSIKRIPWAVKRTIMLDENHVLLIKKDALLIYELSSNRLAPLLIEEEIGSKNFENI